MSRVDPADDRDDPVTGPGQIGGEIADRLDEGRRQVIEDTLESVLMDVLAADEVPYARMEQCGRWQNHDLGTAQALARDVLAQRNQWQNVL